MNMQLLQPVVEKAMQGDKQAYAKLCEEIIQDVLYICIRITGDLHMGEDAAQETLIKMGSSIRSLRSAEAFPSWLNRCITNSCRMHIRSEKRHSRGLAGLQEDIEFEFLPAEWAEKKERRELVLSALKEMPSRQQHLLLMFYFQDMSIKEIAETTKQNPGTTKSNLSYARKSLRNRVEQKLGTSLAGTPAALATIPTLRVIFQRDAALLVTEESRRRILLAVGLGLAGSTATAVGIQHVAALVAGIAPAAIGVALAAAITFTGSPSPSLAPVSETAAWSPSQAAANGEGSLYTEDTISSMAPLPGEASGAGAPTPAPAGLQGSQVPTPSLTPFTATGQCILVDDAGKQLSLPEADLSGIRVQAWQEGTLAAEAMTDSDGKYVLLLPDDTQSYSVRIVFAATRSFTAGSSEHNLLPGSTQVATFELKDSTPPVLRATFLDNQGRVSSTRNPHSIQLLAQDTTPCTLQWALFAYGQDTPVLEGKGELILVDDIAPAERPYSLYISVQDAYSNSTELFYNIYIQ